MRWYGLVSEKESEYGNHDVLNACALSQASLGAAWCLSKRHKRKKLTNLGRGAMLARPDMVGAEGGRQSEVVRI
jgi:hypothetical protein